MINLLLIGTGEYTTGYVPNQPAAPDKQKGVVGLVAFDLKRRGKVNEISLVGTNGSKFPAIRQHLRVAIAECYKEMDVTLKKTFPDDHIECDPQAYISAINTMPSGSAVIIFTPDNTHFEIASHAIKKGLHVLITKPATKTLDHHFQLAQLAKQHNVHVQIEYHKRWDPIYQDAREKIRKSGNFTYFQSYMSQPKSQLQTFKAWAGKLSDISYYLNSHHIDVHCWAMQGLCKPVRVTAFAASGVATKEGCGEGTEDSITLVVDWKNIQSGYKGIGVYTSGWTCPNDVEIHSQQRFSCLCENGEVRVDQAHRGYEYSFDHKYTCLNPLYMKYSPDARGYFAGQLSYGYLSIESFIDACISLNTKDSALDELNIFLPTIHNTKEVTAILEAGRQSLDKGGAVPIDLSLEQ